MNLEIITPDKKLYNGEIKSIKLPGKDGSFGLLNRHAPIIAALKKGVIKVVTENNETESFTVNGGTIELVNNKLIVLAE